MRMLILGAFEAELDNIIQLFPNSQEKIIAMRRCLVAHWNEHEILMGLTGVGSTAAACVTTALCAEYNPDLILMCGVAGGLEKGQEIGDLIIGDKVIDADLYSLRALLADTPYKQCLTDPNTLLPISNEYAIHPVLVSFSSKLPIERLKTGAIVTSNEFPAPEKLFSENRPFFASAIEMEGTGLLKAASYYETPVLIVRAISNLIDEDGVDLGTTASNLQTCSKRLAVFLNHFLDHIPELNEIVSQRQKQVEKLAVH